MIRRYINGLAVLAVLAGVGAVVLPSSTASAAAAERFGDANSDALNCTSSFLGFPAWFDGLPRKEGTCDLAVSSQKPEANENGDLEETPSQEDLNAFIFRIVLNVIEIVLRIIGYCAVGFIIYGGFKYLTSAGSADRITSGRKIITNALIGLVISFMSVAIVNLIAGNLK